MSAEGRIKVSAGAPASLTLLSRWRWQAWCAMSAAVTFVALTCWWLTQDRSIPIYDAGDHLWAALHYHQLLQSGDLLGPFNYTWQYPPLGHLIGALAVFAGGVNVSSPIIGENLLFVAALALGCYQTGKLLFGPLAGLLATLVALGSPLLIAQLHVFMLDAPETAIVALSIWLILASERFSNVKMSAFAGLAAGAGLLIKVQFPFFILGIVLSALALGGWRNWRGLLTFLGLAALLGSPWYIRHLSELHTILTLAGAESGAVSENLPTPISLHNLTWYLWSILNYQLLLPLFLLLVAGFTWTILALGRSRQWRGQRVEFLVGGFVAWLAVTLTPHHDIRYGMPLLPYLAVMATGWIACLSPRARRIPLIVVLIAVLLNTLGTTFGLGGDVALGLDGGIASTYILPREVVLYSSRGFLVAGPSRDGDVPGLLAALRRSGVRAIASDIQESSGPDFSFEGLLPLALVAGLRYSVTASREYSASSSYAFLVHATSFAGGAPCVTLSDGTGVFVVRASPSSGQPMLYCPFHRPQFY